MTTRNWLALGLFAPLLIAGAILAERAFERLPLVGQRTIEAIEPGATVYCAGWIVEHPDQAGKLDDCIAEQNGLALQAAKMLASLEAKHPRAARVVGGECREPRDVRFVEGGFAWRIECYRHVAARFGAHWD